jgi:hypothetical protein
MTISSPLTDSTLNPERNPIITILLCSLRLCSIPLSLPRPSRLCSNVSGLGLHISLSKILVAIRFEIKEGRDLNFQLPPNHHLFNNHISSKSFAGSAFNNHITSKMARRPARCYRYCKNKVCPYPKSNSQRTHLSLCAMTRLHLLTSQGSQNPEMLATVTRDIHI